MSFLQRLLRPRHPRASDSHYPGRLFLLPRWLRDPTRFASLPRHGPLRRPVIRRSTPFFPLSLQEQPLESLFPESLLEETDLYNPFDFIVFVEQNMERVTVADQMQHAKVNGMRYIVCQKQQDILVPASIITPSVQVIKNLTDCSVEDPNLYSYPSPSPRDDERSRGIMKNPSQHDHPHREL